MREAEVKRFSRKPGKGDVKACARMTCKDVAEKKIGIDKVVAAIFCISRMISWIQTNCLGRKMTKWPDTK